MSTYTLSVRTEISGGDVADGVKCSWKEPSWSKAVVLVHGFNVSQTEAVDSYRDFLSNTPLEASETLLGPVFMCFWPGDEPLPVLSELSYPLQIPKAKKSARKFAEFLRSRPTAAGWPLEIVLICHSLGCRLALEMVRCLSETLVNDRIRVTRLILMAAAVPRGHVDENNSRLRPAVKLSSMFKKPKTLFSSADGVLHYAFPIGQIAAFDTGGEFWPRAVGRFGDPKRMWDLSDMGVFDYAHGHYWGHKESAQRVSEYLGIPIGRELDEAKTPEHRALSATSIASRTLPSWTFG
ncbi:alpha/beta hydrolase [bacterium]|nr:MAG: alpha/beta hydrolase [bacterium]